MLKRLFDSGLPALFWGPPGVGKSALVRQFAADHGVELAIIYAGREDPFVLSGLPAVIEGQTRRAKRDWLARLEAAHAAGRPTLLFIDEISTAAPATQAGLLSLILDGELDGLRLPANTRRWAAANPPDQAAGGFELAPPLANRLLHFDWSAVFSDADWLKSFPQYLQNNGVPPEVAALTAAYLEANRSDICRVPADGDERRGKAFPSRRTWEYAARLLAAWNWAPGREIPEHLATALSGAVGEDAALRFSEYLRSADLPRPEDLISGAAELPARADLAGAAVMNLIAFLRERGDDGLWDKAWGRYLKWAETTGLKGVLAAHFKQMFEARKTRSYNIPLGPFEGVVRAMTEKGV